MRWDPWQYARFSDHRSRPFFDLLQRIHHPSPCRIVDLGCGPGELTAALARRWPDAEVTGIDASPEMISRARTMDRKPANLDFVLGDVRDWNPDVGTGVVVSNALLQWVPEHRELLTRWAAALEPGAELAFQVPGNFSEPSHALMRRLAAAPRWRDRLGSVLRHDDAVSSPAAYDQLLREAGLETEVWETTYLHRLTGTDPVLEWARGTGLRPVLDALSASDALEFEAGYAALLAEAYPPDARGETRFPFRRIFAVGVKSPAA